MPRTKRQYPRALKLSVLERLAQGENVSALAREVGVSRELLYRWRAKFFRGGEHEEKIPDLGAEAFLTQQIALLERRIGHQELELEFLRSALQQVRHSVCLWRLRQST